MEQHPKQRVGQVKLMSLLRRKPGLSREEFIRHYENSHVPLIEAILGDTADYRRSYPSTELGVGWLVAEPPIDAVTEIWFKTRPDFERFCAAVQVPSRIDKILEDEARFLDRESMVSFVVEEYGST